MSLLLAYLTRGGIRTLSLAMARLSTAITVLAISADVPWLAAPVAYPGVSSCLSSLLCLPPVLWYHRRRPSRPAASLYRPRQNLAGTSTLGAAAAPPRSSPHASLAPLDDLAYIPLAWLVPGLLELLMPAQPRTPGFRSWPYSLAGLRAPRLVVSTDCPPFPPAPTAKPASGDSSPNLLGVSRTVDASPGMVTIPPFPFLAADGQAVSVSPRPAFPLAGGVGLANASRRWASFPTASVDAASVILPSVALSAATAAQVSENPGFVFPQVPAVDRPSAPRSPVFLPASAPCRHAAPFLAGVPWASASLHFAAPHAVVGLLASAGAQLLLLRAIPASVTCAPLPLDSGAPAAARRLSGVLPGGRDFPRGSLPRAPHPLPLLLPQLSRRLRWSARTPPPRFRLGRDVPRPPVRKRAPARPPRPSLCPHASPPASGRPVKLPRLC
ncbi:unnamed protein product [Closterium sp. Naga37s-1]|nr:unnamed protein product [Closterium sp. Naga37s-1]